MLSLLLVWGVKTLQTKRLGEGCTHSQIGRDASNSHTSTTLPKKANSSFLLCICLGVFGEGGFT